MIHTFRVFNSDRSTTTRHKAPYDLFSNAAMLGLLWLVYSAIRSVTADQFSTATGHASELLQFQASLGLPHEGDLQRVVTDQSTLVKAANIHYIAGHFPVTLIFLGWVWYRHRSSLARIRNTLIAITTVGLGVHMVFPLAPPRMLSGFVNTAKTVGPDPYEVPLAGAANQIAAMPSLHVGWALLVALGIIWIRESRWRYLALIHPAITAAVVVITGNHYLTDIAVAVAIVLGVWLAFGTVCTLIARSRSDYARASILQNLL